MSVHILAHVIGPPIVSDYVLFLRSPIQLPVTARVETGYHKVLPPCPLNVGGFGRLRLAAHLEQYPRRRRFNQRTKTCITLGVSYPAEDDLF